jgi:hypothetical protein
MFLCNRMHRLQVSARPAKQSKKATPNIPIAAAAAAAHQVCVFPMHQRYAALPHPAHHTQLFFVDAILFVTA